MNIRLQEIASTPSKQGYLFRVDRFLIKGFIPRSSDNGMWQLGQRRPDAAAIPLLNFARDFLYGGADVFAIVQRFLLVAPRIFNAA